MATAKVLNRIFCVSGEPVLAVNPHPRQPARESVLPPEGVVRQQLARILQSAGFVQSERLRRFLSFIVEHALAGREKCLKEYLIGLEVYERRSSYDPRVDSIVRTEARRLRYKLESFYDGEGKFDLIAIDLRPGRYVPEFHFRKNLDGRLVNQPSPVTAVRSSQIAHVIAILPFRSLSTSETVSALVQAIPDELACRLMRKNGWKIVPHPFMTELCSREAATIRAMARVGAHFAIEGSVQEERHQIRVITRIIDISGFQKWARRRDVDATSTMLFYQQEQIAAELSEVLDSLS